MNFTTAIVFGCIPKMYTTVCAVNIPLDTPDPTFVCSIKQLFIIPQLQELFKCKAGATNSNCTEFFIFF